MSFINKLSTVSKAVKTATFQQHQIHCQIEKEGDIILESYGDRPK